MLLVVHEALGDGAHSREHSLLTGIDQLDVYCMAQIGFAEVFVHLDFVFGAPFCQHFLPYLA